MNTRRHGITLALVLIGLLGFDNPSGADDVQITTYYPTPYGNHKALGSTDKTTLVINGTDSVHIGPGATDPAAKALLDISPDLSNPKGVLFPRLTTAQEKAIASLADGLLVYNTDNHALEYFDSDPSVNDWVALTTKANGSLWQYIGATQNIRNINPNSTDNSGKVGIGTPSNQAPVSRLEVAGDILFTGQIHVGTMGLGDTMQFLWDPDDDANLQYVMRVGKRTSGVSLGKRSFAFGDGVDARGFDCINLLGDPSGFNTYGISNTVAILNGYGAANNGVTIGKTTAGGLGGSIAIGNYVKATGYRAIAIGGRTSTASTINNNDNTVQLVGGNGGYLFVDQSAGAGTTGNVGIGTVNPSAAKLQVFGTFWLWAPTCPYNTSDIRLKSDVKPLQNSLENLCKLRPVRFRWNKLSESLGHKAGEADIGLIAQEIETIYPNLVDKSGEYESVAYGRLAPIILEAVKELALENRSLEKEVTALEQKLVERGLKRREAK